MKRNPLIPFAFIASVGIVLIFVFSFVGLDNMKDQAEGGEEKTEEQAAANPEEIVKQNCASCHGQNLEGAVGPALNDVGGRLNAEEILDIINNGKGSGMPGGLISGEQATKVAEWLAEQK